MNHSPNDLFEMLKRQKSVSTPMPQPATVFFRLDVDPGGAYLSVVDENNRPLSVDYAHYSDITRDLLKSLAVIRDQNAFRVDWEKPSDRIYLADHDHLLWQLRYCERFVDADFKPIRFGDGEGSVGVVIDSKDDLLYGAIVFWHQGKKITPVLPLTEDSVFADGCIYRIPPLGANFRYLPQFESLVMPWNLEKFLSLLFTAFDRITVDYRQYRQVTGPPRTTQPTLIFEKVDMNHSLYLRIGSTLPDFEAEFFDDYEVVRVATLNDLEKTLIVSDLRHEDPLTCIQEVVKLLRKHRRTTSEFNDFHHEDNLFIIEQNLAKEFIYKELTYLMTRFTVMGAENLKSYKVRTVTPNLQLSLSHGLDFLEGDAALEIEGQTFALFDALALYRRHAYIPLNDGTHAIINKQYLDRLSRIFKKQKENVRISFFDLPIIEELIGENRAQSVFPRSREVFLGFNNLQSIRLEYPELKAELRRYQKQGYQWLSYLHRHQLGGCLADDMGLGKTLQAIAMLATVYPQQQKSSLIIMPRSLLFNWAGEIEKFRPELTYYLYHGPTRHFETAKTYQLILTTYATVRQDIETLKDETFCYIILDESQNIKNLQSQVAKAAMILKSEHRLALSGTPVENNLGELYALFRFLNPAMFGSAVDFNAQYAQPIQRDGDKSSLQELKKKIYPFILRRLKRDVAQDLPDKIEQILLVEMSAEQQALYEQRRRFYYYTVKDQIKEVGIRQTQFFILQALSDLRQIASIPESKSDDLVVSPKREILLERILDIIAGEHKVLVFANYLQALDGVSDDLNKAGIEYLLMTGATRDRETLVRKFQNEDRYRVFLMTLKTGGIGLNLTAADYVFIFDPWWNKAAENQAVDRTHRLGQDRTVFSYQLITKGTIEEKILQLQSRKTALFESLITSDGASLKSLDEEDVDFVLG